MILPCIRSRIARVELLPLEPAIDRNNGASILLFNDNLMKIIETLKEDTNVFVISHKSELEDAHFDRKLQFFKDKNFSKLREIS